MSSSPDFTETGRSSDRKVPGKSNFSHTCSLLSQYLKEKGSFGDLSLGMTCSLQGKGKSEMFRPTTTNLLPKMEISEGVPERKEVDSDRNVKSMDSLPARGGFVASVAPMDEDAEKRGYLSAKTKAAMEPETAQLTIFYGGRVLVFNDFPADKAKEITLLARKGMLPDSSPSSSSANESGNVVSTSGNDPLQRPPQGDASV